MTWMFYLRRPLGRLLSGLFTLGILAVAWFAFGQGKVDELISDAGRAGGGGPKEERLVSAEQLAPVVAELRDRVGPEAELLSVTIRPTSYEFVVRDGRDVVGYRSDDGSTDLQGAEVSLHGSGTVEENAWSIAKLDDHAPERIANAISRKENGDFHLTIATLERETNGKLVWDMKGTVGGRGVAYVAPPDGKRIEAFDPTSPSQSSVPQGVQDVQECISRAGGDPQRLQECASQVSP